VRAKNVPLGIVALVFFLAFLWFVPEFQKPSEKPHERAKRLTIKRVIATQMNASPLSGSLS